MDPQIIIKKSYDAGYVHGSLEATNNTHSFWEQAIKETPGIGIVQEKRIIKKAKQIAKRRLSGLLFIGHG